MMEKNLLNVAEAERELVEKPIFATSAERFLILDEIKSLYRELPQPRRFSKMLSILLERVSTPLQDFDQIAGRTVDRELTPREEARFQAFLSHSDFPQKEVFFSSGHCSYSWEMVVEEGLPGMRTRALARLESAEDSDQREFLLAIIEIYDAIEAYLLRYAQSAREKGMESLAERLTLAATTRPARFDVALQLLWIITMINCAYITENPTLTVGRLDQLLYPLYQADLASGALTREAAAELITDYYCKHNLIMGRGEHQVGDASNSTTFKRICCFDAPQYLLLAGTDEQGNSAVNDLTLLFAECIRPKFKNPVVVVRYFTGLDTAHPALWKVLTEKALQSASLMFYHDGNVQSTFRRIGFSEQEARGYIHFGCNWPSIGTCAAWMQGGPKSLKFGTQTEEEKKRLNLPYMRTNMPHSWPEEFVSVMRELAEKERAGEKVGIEDFYRDFFARMSAFIDRKLEHLAEELAVRQRRPAAVMTFGDCFFPDSIQKAGCFAATAKYHFEFQAFQMFGTVADCFITVDRLVFLEHRLTLMQLLEAVEQNFEGHPDILALCRNVEKYGSDTPHSNAHANRLARTATDLIIEKNRPYLQRYGLFLEPCMQSDTWHLKYGEGFGATPNGRLSGTPFSQNARPSNGAAINGITAMLNAMLSIPSDSLLSGALNLDVDSKQFAGEKGRAIFAALLASYFNRGGLHAQVSTASAEQLREAQLHPEQYRDLRVRVTGYSGIFVDICQRLQDDIINRFE